MTLTADHADARQGEYPDRRGRASEPRRSWASPNPFEVRETRWNSGPGSSAWRNAGAHYATVAALIDFTTATIIGLVVLAGVLPLATALAGATIGAVAFVVLVAAFQGYLTSTLGDGPAEFQAVFRACVTFAVLLMVLGYVLRVDLPRTSVLVGVPVLALGTSFVRHVRRRRLHHRRQGGDAMMSTIVVGDRAAAASVVADLSSATHHGYRVDGVCVPSLDSPEAVQGAPVLGAVADVVQVVADRAAEVVIVAGSCVGGDALRRLSWALGRAGAHLVVVPDIVEVAAPRLTVRPTAGLSLLEVEVDSPKRRLIAKTVLDVTVGTLAGLVILPVVLAAALVVKLTSPGPALFKQTRVGVDGRRFTMLKLRTMYIDADARRAELLAESNGSGVLFKMHDDPRVTPVGKFLRRFSLDELPQLWNVVRGDMSLVGPRPPLECEVAAYEDAVHRRLRVRPGLTGLWQVSGRSDLEWDEAVRLDLRYVDNWSVTMDLLILWKTGRAVLLGSGAY